MWTLEVFKRMYYSCTIITIIRNIVNLVVYVGTYLHTTFFSEKIFEFYAMAIMWVYTFSVNVNPYYFNSVIFRKCPCINIKPVIVKYL